MKASLSTVSSDGRPWSATVEVALIDGYIAVDLKRLYDHYNNLASNNEAVIVLNGNQESIIRAKYFSEIDQGGGVSKVMLQPYWVRLVKEEGIKDSISLQEVNDGVIEAFI
jgi:hypothetical protein